MISYAHDLLCESLSHRLPDSSRSTVLIIGSGLHRHLAQDTAGGPSSGGPSTCNDWNGLLASVAQKMGVPRIIHEDPGATWETLIMSIGSGARSEGQQKQANRLEKRAHDVLAKMLRDCSLDAQQSRPLENVSHRHFRDIICLNFDDTIEQAIEALSGAQVEFVTNKHIGKLNGNLVNHTRWSAEGRHGRIWHPHGFVEHPSDFVLGTRNYGYQIGHLEVARRKFKQKEKSTMDRLGLSGWNPENAAMWHYELRKFNQEPQPKGIGEVTSPLSWLDLFMVSDLVFIGVGLDRAEIDLWWALHQRQRNLMNVSPSVRPKSFVIQAQTNDIGNKGVAPHFATGPAGLLPVLFESWEEAWEVVFGGTDGRGGEVTRTE